MHLFSLLWLVGAHEDVGKAVSQGLVLPWRHGIGQLALQLHMCTESAPEHICHCNNRVSLKSCCPCVTAALVALAQGQAGEGSAELDMCNAV